jgi:Lrp/AsnC family leucine-responsive transcriptional regulator
MSLNATEEMSDLQKRLIRELQEDGRVSYRELAHRLHFSPPTIAAAIRDLESSGVVRKFTVQLDMAQLGFLMRAIVSLSVPSQDIVTGVYGALKEIPQVVRYYRVTGTVDYYVEIAATSLSDLDNALAMLGRVGKTETSIIMDDWEMPSRYLPQRQEDGK